MCEYEKCIYCRQMKPSEEFTLEHIIPQFLGGAQAPDDLKTRNVCKRCNSNLGLFVDASFEKDFLVYNELKEIAYAFHSSKNPTALPLRCMGNSLNLTPPRMEEDEICECWLGPFGEQVWWIRPTDERMYWYAGGNPRTAKKVKTRAYFMFSERSKQDVLSVWFSFKDAFTGYQVKKIMCTMVEGENPKTIGFSEADELDNLRIKYFKDECAKSLQCKNEILMYIRHDVRFMAKLALGISYVLFGHEMMEKSGYIEELYKGLWFKEGDEEPRVQGTTTSFSPENNPLKELYGVDHGVTITIFPSSEGIAVNLNLNKRMNWVVICAKCQDLTSEQIKTLGGGICIVLFKPLNKGLKMTLLELIAHNLGKSIHPDLAEIEKSARINQGQ